MTTFVTGGSGSIGRILVKEFSCKGEKLNLLVGQSSNRDGF